MMKTTLIIISFVTNRAERMENNALWQTNGKKEIKTVNTQESTVFKSNIFSFCGNSGSKHKCIMEVTKIQKKIRKKYNKKCQKLKKLKPFLLFYPVLLRTLTLSPCRQLSCVLIPLLSLFLLFASIRSSRSESCPFV